MRKGNLENSILTRHIERKRDRKKQRLTEATSLCHRIAKQRLGEREICNCLEIQIIGIYMRVIANVLKGHEE